MTDPFRLDGRIAVITGAARGIGLAVARALGSAGATLVLTDLDAGAVEAAGAALRDQGLEVRTALPMDVCDSTVVESTAADVERSIGEVDVIVANAGIVRNTPALETSDDEWRSILSVNLDGVFYTLRAFGRAMTTRGRGSAVVIASMSGLVVNTPQPQAAYNASKAAAAQLARSLAVEWAPYGVRVNAVAPGYVATDLTLKGRATPGWGETWIAMTPLGRLGTPEEVAHCVRFLAADASSFMTGSVMTVDGGYTAL